MEHSLNNFIFKTRLNLFDIASILLVDFMCGYFDTLMVWILIVPLMVVSSIFEKHNTWPKKLRTLVLGWHLSWLCYNSTMIRKKRSDRNHVLYRVVCTDTGDSYIGLTVAQGQAFVRSVKIRWQKHVSRAVRENKAWTMCQFLRANAEAEFRYEVLEIVRGRKPAHQRERELITELEPTLNTF